MEVKHWYTSKLFWLGVLEIAGGIALYIEGLPVETSAITIVSGIITIIFRFVTKTAIGK